MNDKESQIDPRFLKLGDVDKVKDYKPTIKINEVRKLEKSKKRNPLWGTIGWRDDKHFNHKIYNSVVGNNEAHKRDFTAEKVIENIKVFNSKIEDTSKHVVERYINFDATDFNIDWKKIKNYADIPELRLDLFVEQNEGAMVYYHHQIKDNFVLLNDDSVHKQFVQCERTDTKFSTERDKLTYFFKALPPFNYTLNENGDITWTDDERTTSFILKIITFKRSQGTPAELMNEFFDKDDFKLRVSTLGESITYNLFGEKKNGLLIYDNDVKNSSVGKGNDRYEMAGAFYKVDQNHEIDYSKKTLLLIHGTFSSTFNTFEGLVKLEDGGSELKDFLLKNEYEQVIGFDHPTISANVFQNIKDLKKLLGSDKFEHTVSILAVSRGCILAQAIGAYATLPFTVDKCLMFSPANGVGYFDFGSKLATGLGILQKITIGTPATYIYALLQFSADYFLEQPGAQQMTFNSPALNRVVQSTLVDKNSKYTAVVNDWEKILVDKWFKRVGMQVADVIIKLILGNMHDFVVGIKGQKNLPKAFNVFEKPMASIHCKWFEKDELHVRHANSVDLSSFMRRYL